MGAGRNNDESSQALIDRKSTPWWSTCCDPEKFSGLCEMALENRYKSDHLNRVRAQDGLPRLAGLEEVSRSLRSVSRREVNSRGTQQTWIQAGETSNLQSDSASDTTLR